MIMMSEKRRKMKENYSVLMSVYEKEKPEHLKIAMDSMWNQTIPTNDFVLICDGPLTQELDSVINEMEKKHKELHVIRFEANQGLGHALQIGVVECKNEIIARMDSDDISKPERCEKELKVLLHDRSLSICGSNIEEFTAIDEGSFTPREINSTRVVPEKQEEIISFSKRRNPFNHPSVMYRKMNVIRAGNYQNVRYMQDYYLWIHMLIAGCKGYNIQESLVYMRADNNLFKRRSGKLYRNIQLDLFRYMKENKYISNIEYVKSCLIRVLSSSAPNWLRKIVFKRILRR